MKMFSSVQELIDSFQKGHELEFDYEGIGYGLGWADEGPYAYRRDDFGFYEKSFVNMDELLDGFIIANTPLRQLVTKVTEVIMY